MVKRTKKKKRPNQDSPAMIAARLLHNKLVKNHSIIFPTDGSAPKPLMTGLSQALRARYGGSSRVTNLAIDLWMRRNRLAYHQALAIGGDRYDIDGNPTGTVSDEDRIEAEKEVNVIVMQKAEKKAKAQQSLAPE